MTITNFIDDSPVIFRCGTPGCGCPVRTMLSDYVAQYKLWLRLRAAGTIVPGSAEDDGMAEELANLCAALTEEQETEADRRIEEFQMQIKEPA